MSCYNNNAYLPQPPRVWSRVQNACTFTNDNNNGLIVDPYTKELIPAFLLSKKVEMLNKGNVLQYKDNSGKLTKQQRYAKIARGQWSSRRKAWGTQNANGYTDPNINKLKRSGNDNLSIDPITGAIIGTTLSPPTCQQQIIPNNPVIPINGTGGGSIDEPNIPPPVDPSPESEIFPELVPEIPEILNGIQNGGNLDCSVQEDICTGETKSSGSQTQCYPTTDSDVPGPIQPLCWNDGLQTWIPRKKYTMTNSSTKWPVNAQLKSAIAVYPPVITSITYESNFVTLLWTENNSGLKITKIYIYQNGDLITTLPGGITMANIIVQNCTSYQYYIIAGSTGNIVSEPSNIVSITTNC